MTQRPDHRAYATAEIIQGLVAVARGLDGPMSSAAYEAVRGANHASVGTVHGRFGSWEQALQAAGLRSTGARRQRLWSRDEALLAVLEWMTACERPSGAAYTQATKTNHALPSTHALSRLFGGWKGVSRLIASLPSPSNDDTEQAAVSE